MRYVQGTKFRGLTSKARLQTLKGMVGQARGQRARSQLAGVGSTILVNKKQTNKDMMKTIQILKKRRRE